LKSKHQSQSNSTTLRGGVFFAHRTHLDIEKVWAYVRLIQIGPALFFAREKYP
jgi:hypothetical protein